ncbi:hypothetical protein [Emticicia agri]|nr:hypothetical protein [Emticicia agri]
MKVISLLIPVEFKSFQFREAFKYYHNLGLVVAIFVWLMIYFYLKNANLKTWIKALITIPILIISIIAFSIFAIGLCKNREVRDLYIKTNGNEKIVKRSFDCGATTDNDYDILYLKPITPLFNFRWPVDTTTIDKKEWQPVINNNRE